MNQSVDTFRTDLEGKQRADFKRIFESLESLKFDMQLVQEKVLPETNIDFTKIEKMI